MDALDRWKADFKAAMENAWDDPEATTYPPWDAPILFETKAGWVPLKTAKLIRDAAKGRL